MAIEKLNKTDFPGIDPVDLGKNPNVAYGEIDDIRTHAIVSGAASHIMADLTTSTTSFAVFDASFYPATPFTIQVDDERMSVTAVSSSTFTTVVRAQDGTEAAAHEKNSFAYEVLTEYVFLIANHAVKSVDAVWIDAVKQIASTYTAYTGVSGDEHPDFSGNAVVKFTTEAYIAKQRNVEDAGTRDTGEDIIATIENASDLELTDGLSTTVTAKYNIKFLTFTAGYGTINSQRYFAGIENNSGSAASFRLVATEANILKKKQDFTIAAGETGLFSIDRAGGIWNDEFKVVPLAGTFEISSMSKVTNRVIERYGKAGRQLASKQTPISKTNYADGLVAWVEYDDTALGENVVAQTHAAEINITTAGIVRVSSVNLAGNTEEGFRDYPLSATGDYSIDLYHQGGTWDDQTRVTFITAIGTVKDLSKIIQYETIATLSASNNLGTRTSARAVIGAAVSVDAKWAVDEDNNYGGTGSLITRPDWVAKDFLVKQQGFTLAEIDGPSFTAAGDDYETDNYAYAFLWEGEPVSEFARQARSTLNYTGGKWYLNRLPDSAPAAIKTITSLEIEGEGSMFVFDKDSIVNIQNNITARYKPDYKGNWLGLVNDRDSASETKNNPWYGYYDFKFIRDDAMAASVLAHILKQKKELLKTIRFGVLWEKFDLALGDTFDISNPLYNAERFYIENISRNKEIAKITAKGWW